jgi:hypothetical protein
VKKGAHDAMTGQDQSKAEGFGRLVIKAGIDLGVLVLLHKKAQRIAVKTSTAVQARKRMRGALIKVQASNAVK